MIKILTWNIAGLPFPFNNFQDNPVKRMKSIIKLINKSNPSIICLQEVFTKELKKQINEHLHNLKYNVIISNNPSNIFTVNGGLLIASKYKILKIDSINYNKFINELNKIYPYTINKNGLCTFISTNECLDHILLFSKKNIIDSTKNWTIKKKIINYSDHYPLFTKIKFNH